MAAQQAATTISRSPLPAAVTANDGLATDLPPSSAGPSFGLAHLRCRSGDDDTIGRRLVSDAIADAERLGMDALAARWRAATPLLPRAGDALVDVGMARLDGGRGGSPSPATSRPFPTGSGSAT